MMRFLVPIAVLLVSLATAGSGSAQNRTDGVLTDPKAIEAEVHANFASWPAGQVLQKKGFSPKGVSCAQVCELLELGACYEKGRPEVGTHGRAGPCDRPTKKSCWCDSGRRDYGFFHQEAVTSGSKVYRLFGGRIHIGDAETGKSESVPVGEIGRGNLFVGGCECGRTSQRGRTESASRAVTRSRAASVSGWALRLPRPPPASRPG